MPKKFKSFESLLRSDPRFKNKLVGKFINNLMWEGKKSLAQRAFYQALDDVGKKVEGKEPLEIFTTAINNVKPHVEVRSRRVGGATYQVPLPVPSNRQISLAFRWIIKAARSKKGRPIQVKLAEELLHAYKGEGEAIKKRDEVHKMAEANRAFAHLAY